MITDYLNIDLSKELGLDTLPENQRKELEEKMAAVLEGRIMNAIFMSLADEDRAKLEEKLDTTEDVMGLLKEKIPNLEVLMAEEVANFKKDALALNQAISAERGDGDSE